MRILSNRDLLRQPNKYKIQLSNAETNKLKVFKLFGSPTGKNKLNWEPG